MLYNNTYNYEAWRIEAMLSGVGLEEILESFYDGVWIADGKGTILYVNNSWEQIHGMKREEIVGMSVRELPGRINSISPTLSVLEKKQKVTRMMYYAKVDKYILITSNPIFDKDGNIAYVVNNVRDITELSKLKQHLESKNHLIIMQKKELSLLHAMQIKDQLGAVISNPIVQDIFNKAVWMGNFDSTVLIQGESGTGKEIIAKAIFLSGDKKDAPFIKVNCGAIPEQLMESELFGYEKGAFTGANNKGKPGMFELADNGTLFLDEVAEIPLSLQVKLLRVLQEKEIMRIGGTKPIKLNVRVIAATNKQLDAMIKNGTFREDLFYRLNVVTLNIPPLRERPEDIPDLVNSFLAKFGDKYGLKKVISHQVIDMFLKYSWPGNIRELENLIENLVILTPDDVITPSDLPAKFYSENAFDTQTIDIDEIAPIKDAVSAVEINLIKKALTKYGSARKAAVALKIDQSTLVRKMKKLGVKFNNNTVRGKRHE